MQTEDYKLELGARIFFGALVALFWGFCFWGLADADVRNDVGSLLSVVFIFALSLFLVDCILWRLRLDKHGVTQTVYGLDVSWHWREFDSGVIEMDGDGCFVRTDWPWWKLGRKLRLALDYKDREKVLAFISQHCQQSTLLESIEDELQPWRMPPKRGNAVVRILKIYLVIFIVLAIQLGLTFGVMCLWLLFEVAIGIRLLGALDEQNLKLVILAVWGVVLYTTTWWWNLRKSESDKFLELVLRSGLLDKAEIRRACRDIDSNSLEELCSHFVRSGLITEWQCNKLKAGRHRGFFFLNYVLQEQVRRDDASTTYLAVDLETNQKVGVRIPSPFHDSPYFFETVDL